jgi:hypothetical protein
MKRLLLLATAIVTFLAGVTVSRVLHSVPEQRPRIRCGSSQKREIKPLKVSLPPIRESANTRIPYDHYYAIVENTGNKPIRWYVLGFGTDLSNVGASGFMTLHGVAYTYPELTKGSLLPGETRMIPIKATSEFSEEATAWVDFLEFEDGSTWGPNKSRTRRPSQPL